MIRLARPLLALLLAAALAAPALAQTSPVKVTADRFVVDDSKRLATFSGAVVVTRGSMTMTAGQVLLEYGAGGQADIKSLTATGKVRVKTEAQEVTGDKAVYDPKTMILRLSGNVTVSSASGSVQGPEVVVDLNKNTSVFSGGRVTGVFTPK